MTLVKGTKVGKSTRSRRFSMWPFGGSPEVRGDLDAVMDLRNRTACGREHFPTGRRRGAHRADAHVINHENGFTPST